MVEAREIEQWFLKITDYAEQLLDGHEGNRTWLAGARPHDAAQLDRQIEGRANVSFDVPQVEGGAIEVFTTRIDTIYGATALMLSPEHPLLAKLLAGGAGRDCP